MDNEAEAKEFGIDHLPTLVYFEENIPAIYEGDLMNEDEVLEWLIVQKNSATIEEVTDEILTDLIEEHEYVVVYFSKYLLKCNFMINVCMSSTTVQLCVCVLSSSSFINVNLSVKFCLASTLFHCFLLFKTYITNFN